MTKKKGKRNRLNRNTDKLANDNVQGEREIKAWINRYADQGRGEGGKRTYGLAGNGHLQTDGTKGTRRLADKKMDTRTGAQNGYTDWQKLAATKRKKKQETDKQIGGK